MKQQEEKTQLDALNIPVEFEDEMLIDEDFKSLIEYSTRRC